MKVLCPFHDDNTPSMHVYGEWAYCFVCATSCPSEDLKIEGRAPKESPLKVDIEQKLSHVDRLGHKLLRGGLDFPVDDKGYYIVWPDRSYYKRRNWGESKDRYSSPSGVSKPLFIMPDGPHLLVIEGEINALTVKLLNPPGMTICSPGPANDFPRYMKEYLKYSKITLFVDYDPPGVVFGCLVRDELLKKHRACNIVALKKDFNDVLCQEGYSALKESFYSQMGMPRQATMP